MLNHKSLSSFKNEASGSQGMKDMLEIPRRQRPDNLTTRFRVRVYNTIIYHILVESFPMWTLLSRDRVNRSQNLSGFNLPFIGRSQDVCSLGPFPIVHTFFILSHLFIDHLRAGVLKTRCCFKHAWVVTALMEDWPSAKIKSDGE